MIRIDHVKRALKMLGEDTRIYISKDRLAINFESDLSCDAEIDKIVRKGMVDALENGIEELKAEFEKL